ncbi:hypothetical protein [Nocardia puris]|uniref:hypothetical protein n=1 Tax=Nocardia puris TaxID=208602 RepID=UPI002E1D91F3
MQLLEAIRERRQLARAEARQREQAIDTAVRDYLTVWEEIESLKAESAAQIAKLEEQVATTRSTTAERVETLEQRLGPTVEAIRRNSHSDADVATLLGLTPARVRQLLRLAPTQQAATAPPPEPAREISATQAQNTGETGGGTSTDNEEG